MIEKIYQQYLTSNGVSTDTRQLNKGCMFFALKGPNFNANQFAAKAFEQGAKYVVIDDEEFKVDDHCLLVPDVLQALQQLALHHRRQLKIPFIGITGSNGKTTSKELINGVLSKKYKTFATKGNLNNHIGVPVSVLSIGSQVQVAIIEMGANKIGDIAELVAIAEPTHGLITNIGKAHIEGFGSFEGVIRGKSELYHFLIQNNGKIFVNSNNEILANMSKRTREPVFYPQHGDFFTCELLGADPYVKYRHENGEEVLTNLMGRYNFENIAAALCLGKYFEVDPAAANEAISNYVPANNRSQVYKKGSNTILMDAYNANPTSMQAALDNFKQMKAEKKIAILGDMYELGSNEAEEHANIGKITADIDLDEVILCGKKMRAASEANPQAKYFSNKEELMKYLQDNSYQDTHILIKGSRAMALEGIVEFL